MTIVVIPQHPCINQPNPLRLPCGDLPNPLGDAKFSRLSGDIPRGRMPWRASLQSALLSLIIGWVAALAFAGIFLILQRNAILTAFPTYSADKTSVEIQSRADRELGGSPLLLFSQIGVACGVLVWHVGKSVRRAGDSQRAIRGGLIAGSLLAIVQTVIAIILQTPWMFTIPMIAILIGAGGYGAWSGLQPHDT